MAMGAGGPTPGCRDAAAGRENLPESKAYRAAAVPALMTRPTYTMLICRPHAIASPRSTASLDRSVDPDQPTGAALVLSDTAPDGGNRRYVCNSGRQASRPTCQRVPGPAAAVAARRLSGHRRLCWKGAAVLRSLPPQRALPRQAAAPRAAAAGPAAEIGSPPGRTNPLGGPYRSRPPDRLAWPAFAHTRDRAAPPTRGHRHAEL